MDPAEFSSLNELLDRIAALGIPIEYDRIGPKTDQGEIKTLLVTHQIAVVEEQDGDSSPIPKTDYARIADPEEPDTHQRKDVTGLPNIESDGGPKQSEDTQEPGLLSPDGLQTPDNRSGRGSNVITPTHPDIDALMSIKQQYQEKVHHLWTRFLLVKDKVKDCRDENAVSAFCNNCTDEGILNAINRRRILKFADLATIVQKYSAMESTWKTQAARWEPSVPIQLPLQAKRAYPRGTPNPTVKKHKATIRQGTVLQGWLDGPCKIHTTTDTVATHSLRACWIVR